MTFIKGRTDLGREDGERLTASGAFLAMSIGCAGGGGPTEGLCGHYQSDDLDLHSKSHVRLRLLTCSISGGVWAVAFTLGMTVADGCHNYICSCSFR